jgi:glycerophosphoryl diester phosphodiesterase
VPLWISHRGLTEAAPENTLAAFDAAVVAGFTAVETDLRLTRDGRIVLAHDPDLSRLCGDPRRLRELDAAEVAGLRVHGHPLVFFEDFARRYADLRWTLDLKPPEAIETVAALSRLPGAAELVQRAMFLAWHPTHEQAVAAAFPGARFYAQEPECRRAGAAVLFSRGIGGGIRAARTYALSARFHGLSLFRRPVIDRYHARGARVVAFLPESDDDARAAVEAGVDEVLTDRRRLS